MSLRFNNVFFMLLGLGVLCAFVIPPSITNRAKGKEELLLWPIVRPVRGIASLFVSKYGANELPPGEKTVRNDSELSVENSQLRQQVTFLTQQLEDLKLVEAERKRLGRLLDYFIPVAVIGSDATPGRESLSLAPSSSAQMSPNTAVMCPDGLVGRFVEGRRIRLITDSGFTLSGEFGRWTGDKWTPLGLPKASARGIGNGMMRVDNLTVKEAETLKEGDWIILADNDYEPILQGRQIGQVESKRPLPNKTLFAEIIIKPRSDLRKLREVLVMKK